MYYILKNFRFPLLLLSILSTNLLSSQVKEPADHVNPFLGTDFFGHTYPGAALPFAMVHLSPDTGTEGWKHCAGYVHSAGSIMGFSHTHWSGVGMVDGGDILLMPVTGNKLYITPGSEDDPDKGYRSRFSHENEQAYPGYYSVFLDDYGISAELTSTTRVGFHRYTFPKTDNARIIIDLGHKIGKKNEYDSANIRITGDRYIEGEKTDGPGKIYFTAKKATKTSSAAEPKVPILSALSGLLFSSVLTKKVPTIEARIPPAAITIGRIITPKPRSGLAANNTAPRVITAIMEPT